MVKTLEFAVHYDRDFQELCIHDCTMHKFESAGTTVDEIVDDVCRAIGKHFGNDVTITVNQDDVRNVNDMLEIIPRQMLQYDDINPCDDVDDMFEDHYIELGTIHINVNYDNV